MRPRGIDQKLDRALRRLGNVSPEVLERIRDRVRRSLRIGALDTEHLALPLDASPPNLWPIRWPIVAASALILIVIGGAIGGVWRWKAKLTEISHKQRLAPQLSMALPPKPELTERQPVKREQSHSLPRAGKQNRRAPAAAGVAGEAAVQERAAVDRRTETRFALLPPGTGKLLLDRACTTCHRERAVERKHFATKAEYADLVSRMVSYGAPLSADEANTLAGYLFENLKSTTEPVAATTGKAILERACTTCHSLNGIGKYNYASEDAYRDLVSAMVSYGAVLNDDDAATLVRYLFAMYGKK